ncbi:hypothetical protein TNIN_458501 [Trichonephila inaurata madagascariensis]|uniref:Secreted protein n=1 Tax=Trichonephila inaurata madagascariensis TaxID=2747483 RepID=A0A8X6MF13_9ARAC|nr:hypothetical protein TNIN_458501 [Trichonephila inaurata madagascariensis]
MVNVQYLFASLVLCVAFNLAATGESEEAKDPKSSTTDGESTTEVTEAAVEGREEFMSFIQSQLDAMYPADSKVMMLSITDKIFSVFTTVSKIIKTVVEAALKTHDEIKTVGEKIYNHVTELFA